MLLINKYFWIPAFAGMTSFGHCRTGCGDLTPQVTIVRRKILCAVRSPHLTASSVLLNQIKMVTSVVI